MVTTNSIYKRISKWHYMMAILSLLIISFLLYFLSAGNDKPEHRPEQDPTQVQNSSTAEAAAPDTSTAELEVTPPPQSPSIDRHLKTRKKLVKRSKRALAKATTYTRFNQAALKKLGSDHDSNDVKKISWTYPRESVSTWLSPQGDFIALRLDEEGTDIGIYHCRTGELVHRIDSDSFVYTVSFSPNGKKFTICDDNFRTKLFDTYSGDLIHQLIHQSGIAHAVFSPNGRYLATDSGGSIKILDLRTNKITHTMRADGFVSDVTFSPNGEYIAYAAGDRVKIYSLPRAASVGEIRKISQSRGIIFSSDSKQLTVGDSQGLIIHQLSRNKTLTRHKSQIHMERVIHLSNEEIAFIDYRDSVMNFVDTKTNKVTEQLQLGSHVNRIILSPNGKSIIVASSTQRNMEPSLNRLKVYDIETKKHVSTISVSDNFNNLCISSDKQYVVCATDTDLSLIPIKDLLAGGHSATPITQKLVKKHLWDLPKKLDFDSISPYTDIVALSTNDGKKLFIHNLYTGKELKSWDFQGYFNVPKFEFSPDGRYIACSRDRIVAVLDLKTNSTVARAKSRDGLLRMAFDDNSKHLVTNCYKNRIEILDIEQDQPLATYRHSESITAMSVSKLGSYVATCSDDKTAKLFSMGKDSQLLATLSHDARVNSVIFSPFENYLATSGDDGKVILYDIAHRKEKASFSHSAQVNTIAFSPDGLYLSAAGDDGAIIIYNIEQDSRSTIKSQGKQQDRIFFTPNSQYIVTTGADGTVCVLDVAHAKVLDTLRHTESISRSALSPDGSKLATLSHDKTIFIYDMNKKKSVGMIQHTRNVEDLRFSHDGKSLLHATADAIFSTPLD